MKTFNNFHWLCKRSIFFSPSLFLLDWYSSIGFPKAVPVNHWSRQENSGFYVLFPVLISCSIKEIKEIFFKFTFVKLTFFDFSNRSLFYMKSSSNDQDMNFKTIVKIHNNISQTNIRDFFHENQKYMEYIFQKLNIKNFQSKMCFDLFWIIFLNYGTIFSMSSRLTFFWWFNSFLQLEKSKFTRT